MISFENLSFYYMNESDFYDENVWYHDDYADVNEHIETDDFHEISETAAETELEMSDNSDEQSTTQLELADFLTKLCVCKECHWEFSSENQLHCHLLICQKHCNEISETWMTELKSLIFLVILWALKVTCKEYVFQE